MIRINGADVPLSGNPTRSRMTKSSFGNKGQHWKDYMECPHSSSVLGGKGNQIGIRNVNITSRCHLWKQKDWSLTSSNPSKGKQLVYSGNENEKRGHVEGVTFMLKGLASSVTKDYLAKAQL